MRILIVDDEPDIVEIIESAFEDFRPQYVVSSTTDCTEAVRLAAEHRPDLVILDVSMPGKDGFEVCRDLRATSNVPVIFLTARTSDLDIVRGLGLGADDYIAKPFIVRELVARADAVLRRSRGYEPVAGKIEVLTGGLRIEMQHTDVWRDGQPLHLTTVERKVMNQLASRLGEVVTRAEIVSNVWGVLGDREAHCLTVYIQRLRDKLETEPDNPEYLLTARGAGYLLAMLPPTQPPNPATFAAPQRNDDGP